MTSQPEGVELSDLLIIGGGPTGMFAAFYCGMRQASVTLIESMPQLGGQLAALYPEKYIYDVAGFPKITAQELVDNLSQQMQHFEPNLRLEEKVTSVVKQDERHFIVTTDKGEYHSRAIIITAGVGAFEPRRLDVEGAEAFEKANLHYFVNDLSRFKGRKVLITGGGDSAVDWALMLEPIAEQVTLIHRRDKFRAHEHSVENLMNSKVNVVTPTEITALHGEETINKVTLTHVKTKETQEIEVDDVIVNFGFVSSLGPLQNGVFKSRATPSSSILVQRRIFQVSLLQVISRRILVNSNLLLSGLVKLQPQSTMRRFTLIQMLNYLQGTAVI
ncbi:thioredoxin reductase [Paenibacillus pini JCM 16418]|uniref:Ferredoxin--NADP reductase n=1 Tax=Paenibacillus pini JCM 16418 TaxID=1236976 RepID=W7YCH9_9BACL|nr:thioredoxin reductase [Paenibacillus pini JCM 16418]